MYTFLLPLLMAPPPEGADGAAGPGLISSLLPFVAVILIFYFLIIRPQSKKRKETEKMLSALKKGDRIVTIGGLYGTIQSVKDTSVIIKADDNVKLEFLRSAISSVVTVAPAKEEKSKDSIEDNSEADKNEVSTNESGA
ncbi:MAG: preprotein translocase subunit YajC [Treponema sp.]|nr:preprotein translocase subunit YajC [Treponema sp.]